ncbi:30S ribosome-binding factor RbfA [Anaerolineales bacterium]
MSLKQDRTQERIRVILSDLLLFEISDPRLQGVTITEVKVDLEIAYANVYVNALGDESRKDEILAGLQHAKGFLRREVGKRIHLRRVPDLIFHWDHTLEHGEHINQVIDKLDIPPAPIEEITEEDNDDPLGFLD